MKTVSDFRRPYAVSVSGDFLPWRGLYGMQYKKKDISDKIMEAGRREYGEKGFRGGNISKIAADCGVPVGNLYRYFDGKLGLLDAIVRPAYNEIPKFIEELAELDQREPMPLDVQLTRISEELLKAFDKYGREILILCDKCASTRYDDFFEKLVACVNRVVLRKIYTDPTDDDKLFCEFIAQAFLNSLLDVLRKGLTREQMTEMVHRLLVFYFEKIEDRI